MALKISHSSIRTYSECGLKYKYHYLHRLRQSVISGALLFGSAYDKALGALRDTGSLDQAKEQFLKSWSFQDINGKYTQLSRSTSVVYAQKDYDSDLIFEANEKDFTNLFKQEKSLKQLTAFYRELKKEKGFAGLTEEQKIIYNYGHWICLLNKGLIMLEGYHKHIFPRIKKTHAQQKQISIKNSEGDEITGYIDFIATLDDGKCYILDDKTSSMEYDSDSAMQSPQLILYFHAEKENYKAHGVGFIVSYKQLLKNKKKVCTICNFDGSGGRHKTCPNEVVEPAVKQTDGEVLVPKMGRRCNGEWKETIAPEARFDVILNEVPESAEALVMETFDLSAEGIKKEVFTPNLNACGNGDWTCPYKKLCWKGKDEELIVLPERKR